MNGPLPLLIADAAQVITVLVLILIVGVPMLGQVLAKMRPQQPPARGPRPGGPARPDSSVQDEIDDFLRRVSGRRGTGRPTVAAAAPKPKRPETPSRN